MNVESSLQGNSYCMANDRFSLANFGHDYILRFQIFIPLRAFTFTTMSVAASKIGPVIGLAVIQQRGLTLIEVMRVNPPYTAQSYSL